MPLLSYDPMDDGDVASANLWNVRLSAIHDLLNGNLDAANLANGAVTTPKIADGAVTSAKMSVTVYVDANGWTVKDYGSRKEYYLQYSGSTTLNAYAGTTLTEQLLPEGVASINDVNITWSVRNAAWEFQYIVATPNIISNKIRPLVYNASALNSKNDTFVFDFSLEDKS